MGRINVNFIDADLSVRAREAFHMRNAIHV